VPLLQIWIFLLEITCAFCEYLGLINNSDIWGQPVCDRL
jgi:hypothetical protein